MIRSNPFFVVFDQYCSRSDGAQKIGLVAFSFKRFSEVLKNIIHQSLQALMSYFGPNFAGTYECHSLCYSRRAILGNCTRLALDYFKNIEFTARCLCVFEYWLIASNVNLFQSSLLAARARHADRN